MKHISVPVGAVMREARMRAIARHAVAAHRALKRFKRTRALLDLASYESHAESMQRLAYMTTDSCEAGGANTGSGDDVGH